MVYQPRNANNDNNTSNHAENQNTETLQPKHVYAMYNQSAVQHTVCHFMAVHVLLGLPIVLKNYSVKTYNCVGRKTVTKKSTKEPINISGEFGQIFDPTIIEHFDNRVRDLDLDDERKEALATRRLGQQNLALIRSTTSLRTILDKFHWTRKRNNDSGKQEYQISIRNRFPSGKIVYNALRFVPHIQMSHANPNSKYFSQFCKVMVLCFAEYDEIAINVLSDLEAYKNSHPNITDPKIIQEQYWIETFYATFPRPNFIGLPPSYRGYAKHYHDKLDNINIFSDSEDEDDDDINTSIRFQVKEKPNNENNNPTGNSGANAKKVKEKYYQTLDDRLHAPPVDDEGTATVLANEDTDRLNQLSHNFLEAPTIESDCSI